ncbi:MAG: hypothetical protein KF762_07095 [Acidobacteria bacterium]|nr:hypothetical protein [Acidobacteriota bacterium]
MENAEMSAADDKDGLLALVEGLMRPFHKKDMKFVTKLVNPQGVNPHLTYQNFFERIELFNAVFPETAYEVTGFTRYEQGRLWSSCGSRLLKGVSRPATKLDAAESAETAQSFMKDY